MNRLVLIGNGFDLAHGLETSYKDFIEYLWSNIYENLRIIASKRDSLFEEEEDLDFVDNNNLIKIYYRSITIDPYYYIKIYSGGNTMKIPIAIFDERTKISSDLLHGFISSIANLKKTYLNDFF